MLSKKLLTGEVNPDDPSVAYPGGKFLAVEDAWIFFDEIEGIE